MPDPAVRLDPWLRGPEPVTLTPGEDDFAALLPISEPLSEGPVPIAPSLISRLSTGKSIRAIRGGDGQLVTHGLETSPRPDVELVWGAITKAERDTLMAFLRGDCGQTLGAFDVEADGIGSSGGAKTFRLVAPPTERLLADGVYQITAQAEEIFT